MNQKSQKDWFIICTKARQEFKVLEHNGYCGEFSGAMKKK